jgi:uncharacterized protein (DUF362 family)
MRAEVIRLAETLGWSHPARGSLGGVIPPGARVLVKPNWVHHENAAPYGMEPLITHAAMIRAVVELLLEAGPESVTIGDAPIQGCDFEKLIDATGLRDWSAALQARDARYRGILDFRRTKAVVRDGVREAKEDLLPIDQFVLFDLGPESLLDEITSPGQFRVTQYDPRLMAATHAPGRHQYLVAKAVIDADVVVNLPKLKTHKKAGITCALKNLIGINGNKEYLPHHRVGGSEVGGDCYPGASPVKRLLEFTLDRANTAVASTPQRAWSAGARALDALARASGDTLGVEGSWSGNDTIWRTCLDLNRVLVYGTPNATMSDVPQRQVLHIVDAVVGGQGDGPLAPIPLPLGMLLAGRSAAAVDWVGAQLLGYDPEKIPIASHAFDAFRWPLVPFREADVATLGDLGSGRSTDVLAGQVPKNGVQHPVGWRSAATRAR